MSKKVLYYINQFFGQIGGEEMAHVAPTFNEKQLDLQWDLQII